MTCVVGLKHNGKVHIAADSAGVAGYSVTSRADEKTFQNGAFIFGFAGSFRIGQVLRYSFNTPDYDPRRDFDEYMINDFILTLRKTLEICGCLKKESGIDTASNAIFLLGSSANSELYCIESDFQVGKNREPYEAIGSGADFALGSLASTEHIKDFPRRRLEIALQAAEKYSGSVQAPFTFVEI